MSNKVVCDIPVSTDGYVAGLVDEPRADVVPVTLGAGEHLYRVLR